MQAAATPPVFQLSQPEFAGLCRLANSLMQGKDEKQQLLIKEIGSAAATPLFLRDFGVVDRFKAFLEPLGTQAPVDLQVATGTGQTKNILELGTPGKTAAVVLDFFRKMVVLGAHGGEPEPEEIEPTIAKYWRAHTEAYLDNIGRFSTSMPTLDAQAKTTICIPVADHEEGDNIYKTLDLFRNQSIPLSQFEIVLFLNHPLFSDPAKQVMPDHTRSEVERFQQDHPELKVHFFQAEIPEKFATIGYVRKVLNDVVLHRYYQRGDFSQDHILVRVDADTCGVHSRFLENYLTQFERNPKVDAFKGQLDWDWPTLLSDPILLFGTRLYMAMNRYAEIKTGEIGGGGANFAVRASRYAAVFGYKPSDSLGEDVNFGRQLKAEREDMPEFTAIASTGARSRLWTSSRRSAAAVKAGNAPVLQWSRESTLFSLCNPDIRKAPPPQAGKSFAELLQADDFTARLEAVTEQTVAAYSAWHSEDIPRGEFVDAVLHRTFGLTVGQHDDGTIKVTDCSSLKTWLLEFSRYAPDYWATKLGF